LVGSDFETFLKMLTVQMKNQDPLDPIKSEDYAVQLATFSGVEQQVKTNDLITKMTSQLGLMGMSQMAGWVGMEAKAPVAGYFDGTPITLAPNPPQTADRTDLVIRDESGNEVQRTSIAATDDQLSWAGVNTDGSPFANGLYSFQTESFNNGQLTETNTVEVYATIVEARNDAGQTVLVTNGGAVIPSTNVSALRNPALAI
jgi:flagellar basal-body rod modification protein FlgD